MLLFHFTGLISNLTLITLYLYQWTSNIRLREDSLKNKIPLLLLSWIIITVLVLTSCNQNTTPVSTTTNNETTSTISSSSTSDNEPSPSTKTTTVTLTAEEIVNASSLAASEVTSFREQLSEIPHFNGVISTETTVDRLEKKVHTTSIWDTSKTKFKTAETYGWEGNYVCQRTDEGEWQFEDWSKTSATIPNPADIFENAIDIKFIGTEDVQTNTCYVIEFNRIPDYRMDILYIKVWVDVQNFLPQKAILAERRWTDTMEYSYNDKVVIEIPKLPSSSTPQPEKDETPNLPASTSQPVEHDYLTLLGMNTQNEHLKNVKVRMAVYLTINRDSLASVGREKVVGIVSPNNLNVNLERNIATAKGLLAEAGYGTGFSTELFISDSNMTESLDIAESIQKNLADVGIICDIRLVTNAVFASLVNRKSYTGLFLTSIMVTGKDTADILGSVFLSTGDSNYTGYNNTQFDQMFNTHLYEKAEDIAFDLDSGGFSIVPLFWK